MQNSAKKNTLIGFTCTYNESELVPYVMPYVERLKYDKFIVYDNMSTDNTVELLSKYDFVEIRQYDTGGKFDEDERVNLFFKCYQELYNMYKNGTKNIWMTFTDFDEVIYFDGNILGSTFNLLLTHLDWHGYNVYDGDMFNLISEDFPKLDNTRALGKYVHTNKDVTASLFKGSRKPVLFKIDGLEEVFADYGFHLKSFVYKDNKEIKSCKKEESLYSFHLKYIGYKNRQNSHFKPLYTYGNDDIYNEEIEKLIFNSFPVKEIFKERAFNHISVFSGILDKNTGKILSNN